MRIGSHGLREHLRFLMPLFGLIATVWLLRLVMDKAGTPPAVTRLVSVTVAGAASVLLAAVLIHFKAFGSYPSVVVAAFLLELWTELLICSAIAFSVLTHTNNIYTAPEYSPPNGQVAHIIGHLTFGLGLGTLYGAGVGCLLLWLLRRIVPATGAKTHFTSGHGAAAHHWK